KDYSVIGSFKTDAVTGTCVYCNHCQPCPAGIDIGLVNKYYDLALAGDAIAANHYTKLSVKADACLHCGHCERRCPFGAKQMERMREIDEYFRRKPEIPSHIRRRERRKFCLTFPFIRGIKFGVFKRNCREANLTAVFSVLPD
ncbi:MAG: 4Fe-4S binding protein, partial [Eubacteriales bacterium]|nr:4Fe-4S binding protein [Eubacteriales bacterium]